MDIDDEILRDNLILIFTNVLWTKFHLSSLYIVTLLYKCSIKHDTKHDFVRKASVLENNLNIPM